MDCSLILWFLVFINIFNQSSGKKNVTVTLNYVCWRAKWDSAKQYQLKLELWGKSLINSTVFEFSSAMLFTYHLPGIRYPIQSVLNENEPTASLLVSVTPKGSASYEFREAVPLLIDKFHDVTVIGIVLNECVKLGYNIKRITDCVPQNDPKNGFYTCGSNGRKLCRKGWMNPENKCLDDNLCHDVCKNYRACFSSKEKIISCHCKKGWEGFYCDRPSAALCTSGSCLNKGYCHKVDQKCICRLGFYGANCEHKDCPSNSSFGSGGAALSMPTARDLRCSPAAATCLDERWGTACFCRSGFAGLGCMKSVNPVAHQHCGITTCLNGGTCSAIKGDFLCKCLDGYEGRRCESVSRICESSSTLCPKSHVCINTVGSYKCMPRDEQDCKEGTCHNNATCKEGKFHFLCVCPRGFRGPRCDH